MKKTLVIIAISLLLIANNAFGADLVGTWSIQSDCVRIGGYWDGSNPLADKTGVYSSYSHQIVITDQNPQTGLFKGYSCDSEIPNTFFYGAIDGKTIYITNWDSVTTGKVSKNSKMIEFVSQNQQDNPASAPGTCIGTATKESPTFDCDPLGPLPGWWPPYN